VFMQSPNGYWRTPLEDVASGWAIQDAAQLQSQDEEEAKELLQLVGGRHHEITTRHVAQAAEMGSEFALSILAGAWEGLAEGICQVIALLCPRRIIIGGGVSLIGEMLLFRPLRTMVAERVFRPFAGSYEIVPAALGEEVVVHGALALARRHLVR
jgi:glucokinase